MFLLGIGLVSALLAVCVSSCKSNSSYVDERAEKAVLDTQKAKYMELNDGNAYTLDQCIRYALRHNLQVRLHELDVKIANENKMAELMGMLPELNFNENFTSRSETAASSSEKIKEGGRSYGYSTSEERQVNYFNIDLLFSVLDLGLSYWNTEIAHNKVFLHKQRSIRMTQTIQLDVVKASARQDWPCAPVPKTKRKNFLMKPEKEQKISVNFLPRGKWIPSWHSMCRENLRQWKNS